MVSRRRFLAGSAAAALLPPAARAAGAPPPRLRPPAVGRARPGRAAAPGRPVPPARRCRSSTPISISATMRPRSFPLAMPAPFWRRQG